MLVKTIKRFAPESVKPKLRDLFTWSARTPIGRQAYMLRLRRLVRSRQEGRVSLHLGCGAVYFRGWVNIDFAYFNPLPDVLLDLSKGIPLPDGSVDYIYSEEFIEHFDFRSGSFLLAECSRVLKFGGVMRILTPDLKSFVTAYLEQNEGHLRWYNEKFGCTTFAQMLNTGMRAWGHQFLYDRETLTQILDVLGFSVKEQTFQSSEEPLLRGLDTRNTCEGVVSIYYDCVKVKTPDTSRASFISRYHLNL